MIMIVLDKLTPLLLLALCRHEGAVGFGPLTPAAVYPRTLVSAGTAGDDNGASPMFDKCPVLICPAQLSVPSDYELMIAEFKER